jgi:hypothetical protein
MIIEVSTPSGDMTPVFISIENSTKITPLYNDDDSLSAYRVESINGSHQNFYTDKDPQAVQQIIDKLRLMGEVEK